MSPTPIKMAKADTEVEIMDIDAKSDDEHIKIVSPGARAALDEIITPRSRTSGKVLCKGYELHIPGGVHYAQHRAVETKVKARIDKMKSLFCIEYKKKKDSIVLVHLSVHIIAPINNSPLPSVLYPSDNTLSGLQIDNFIGTKVFVVIDAVS